MCPYFPDRYVRSATPSIDLFTTLKFPRRAWTPTLSLNDAVEGVALATKKIVDAS